MFRYIVFILLLSLVACTPRIHYIGAETTYIKTTEPAVDKDISDMVAPYKARLDAEMNKVIGKTEGELIKAKPESALGNFVADLIYEKGKDYYDKNIDFAIVNYGGLRIPNLPKGDITKGQIFELMPFDNMLVVVDMDAATVRQLFSVMAANGGWPISKGVNYRIKEEQAVDILIDNKPIEENKTYKVIMSDYLANGGDKLFFLVDKKRDNLGVLFRDAMLEYIIEQEGTAIDAKVEGRVFE